MNRFISLGIVIGLIAVSCTDPDIIALEIHPTSDNIIIGIANVQGMTSETESEDSLRTDEALNLVLGKIEKINNLDFGDYSSRFLTQILLTENNTDLGTNPKVDAVVLSYTYSGYYGELEEFPITVRRLDQPIYKDSIYYSDFSYLDNGEILDSSFMLNVDELNPLLQVNLSVAFAQDLFNLGNEVFVDNETFLTYFNGLSVSCDAENTMLYLNPDGSNSYLKIYYHNDENESDTLSLDFELGGETARFSLFNEKDEEDEQRIISDYSRIYIQSMAGYKAKILINDIDSLKALLDQKAINKVTMSFDAEQAEYAAHDRLFLVRVDQEGNNMFLRDLTWESETHFGGRLENNKYEFNITRYFDQLLNDDSYTNDLYLLPAGAAVNANRTILNKDISLTIHYSEL